MTINIMLDIIEDKLDEAIEQRDLLVVRYLKDIIDRYKKAIGYQV